MEERPTQVVEIICYACGRKTSTAIPQGPERHTVVHKCECGSTIQYQSAGKDSKKVIEDINALLGKLPAILGQWKNSKRQSLETGVDAAVHDLTKEIALEILKEDPALRQKFKEFVKEGLETSIDGGEEAEAGEGEVPSR